VPQRLHLLASLRDPPVLLGEVASDRRLVMFVELDLQVLGQTPNRQTAIDLEAPPVLAKELILIRVEPPS